MNTRTTFNRVLVLFISLALLIALAGCGNTEQAKVLDEFVRHTADRDAKAAYEHFSALTKNEVTLEALETALKGDFGDIVQGYKSLTVTNLNIQTSNNETYTEMSGTVNYNDGSQRNFTARLDKENDLWLVTSMNIE